MKAFADPRFSPARRHGGSTLLGVFIGLVVGVVIAAAVVLYLNKSTLPFQQNKSADGDKAAHSATPSGAAPTPQSLPGKPGDKPPEKRFTFYDILPGNQEAVPGATPTGPVEAPVQGPVAGPSVTGEMLYLQVGAFQKSTEADNLKAKLALLGLEAGVQEVTVPDKGTLFRVRVGPYATLDDMNRARALLAQNAIAVSVVKTRDAAAN
jgi:cell division protein FtsN